MISILFFILMLSVLFVGITLLDIIIRLFQSEPEKMKFETVNKLLLYGSIAYILTYIFKIIEYV